MYRKITDGVKTFDHSGEMVVGSKRPDPDAPPTHNEKLEPPMTYIACPRCISRKLVTPCNCYPSNFTCTNCGWKHINHLHGGTPAASAPVKPSNRTNVNDGAFLSKIIRK